MVKNFFKLDQTRHGVSHGYLESKAKRFFGITYLGKKLVFHTEFCEFREQRILKIGLFHGVKELSKSNQTRHGVSHEYLKSKPKIVFGIPCVEKSWVFIRKFAIIPNK